MQVFDAWGRLLSIPVIRGPDPIEGMALALSTGELAVGIYQVRVHMGGRTFTRTLVVIVVLGAILFATGQISSIGAIGGRTWAFLTLSGLATGASWVCYFRALKLGPATLVAPIDKLSVVLVALFGVIFLGERPSLNGWIGIALIAAGAVLIVFKR